MNFWTFFDRNTEVMFVVLLVICGTCAIIFGNCKMPDTTERHDKFLKDCMARETPVTECVKLSKEI